MSLLNESKIFIKYNKNSYNHQLLPKFIKVRLKFNYIGILHIAYTRFDILWNFIFSNTSRGKLLKTLKKCNQNLMQPSCKLSGGKKAKQTVNKILLKATNLEV